MIFSHAAVDMNKSDMITAAKIAGIPVYENAETPGGVKFGECSIHDLVRFAQIITNRSLERDAIKSQDSTQVAVVGDLSEFGPLLTWTRHWSTITPKRKPLSGQDSSRVFFCPKCNDV